VITTATDDLEGGPFVRCGLVLQVWAGAADDDGTVEVLKNS
jgi:hypothetical protein